MMRHRLPKILIATVACALAVAGCSTTSTQPPTASPSVQDSADPAAATVAGLAATLSLLHGGNGEATCPGEGSIQRGDALRCHWFGVGEEPLPVYVSVLDDNGRFVFRDAPRTAVPEDYPPGTTSCSTLAQPPSESVQASDSDPGLDFPLLLHFWMAAGSPAAMDDDGNGVPCETVYPAEVVQRVMASPLQAVQVPVAPAAFDDVVAYAEAWLTGTTGTGELRCESKPAEQDEEIVAMGSAADCGFFTDGMPPDYGTTEPLPVVLTVLDDTGRFLPASGGECCGGALGPLAYPATATCDAFLAAPPDGHGSQALEYGQVVFWWNWHDRPAGQDPDEDGRPCEAVYPAGTVDATLNGWLQP